MPTLSLIQALMRTMENMDSTIGTAQTFGHVFNSPPPSRFRFKSEHDKYRSHSQSRRRNRKGFSGATETPHSHSHRRKRQKFTKYAEDDEESKHHETPTSEMDAEQAFRESLFDAMADDEGAAYWEGVYGQPIHNYPDTKTSHPDNIEGQLERMSDEEYVAYVREQMFEKTHQHIFEERKARAEAAKRYKEDEKKRKQTEKDRDLFNRKMEESLRQGEERKKEKAWRDSWRAYIRKWEDFLAINNKSAEGMPSSHSDQDIEKVIPWPVRSGRAEDVSKREVEEFFQHEAARQDVEDGLRALLKVERVRYHPDKMQQKLGRLKMGPKTSNRVTAVFQIVDDMYNAEGVKR